MRKTCMWLLKQMASGFLETESYIPLHPLHLPPHPSWHKTWLCPFLFLVCKDQWALFLYIQHGVSFKTLLKMRRFLHILWCSYENRSFGTVVLQEILMANSNVVLSTFSLQHYTILLPSINFCNIPRSLMLYFLHLGVGLMLPRLPNYVEVIFLMVVVGLGFWVVMGIILVSHSKRATQD